MQILANLLTVPLNLDTQRQDETEKLLVVIKNRNGHSCKYAWIVISMVLWEAISQKKANSYFDIITQKAIKFGKKTERKSSMNMETSCACQGTE